VNAFRLTPPGDGRERRAALAVHAAHPSDREWLLREIGEPHRARLAPLLEELGHLGIAPDSALVREALEGEPAHRGPATPASWHPDAADPRSLARVLSQEPAALVAQVLALMSPPRPSRVLRCLASPQRRRVEEAMSVIPAAGPVAPAWRDAVFEELAKREALVPASPWHRLPRRLFERLSEPLLRRHSPPREGAAP
jgi:hypothetical protein